MSELSFKLIIVSPKRELFNDNVEFVSFDTPDGEYGVLYNAAPFVTRITSGVIKLIKDKREMQAFTLDGFACVTESVVTIFSDACYWPSEVDTDTDDDTDLLTRKGKSETDHKYSKARIALAMQKMRSRDLD